MALRYPDPVELYRALGSPAPPARVTQPPFDGDPGPVQELARRPLGRGPCEGLVHEYALDLMYVRPLQPDLMAYVLPLCLETWQDVLRSNRASGAIEQLHAALARHRRTIAEVLGEAAETAVQAFVRDSVLARMAEASSLRHHGMAAPAYTWIYAVSTFGAIATGVGPILDRWDALGCDGHAVAWLQYASVLAFGQRDNPVFDPWTPNDGGGPPELWDFASVGFEECWLEADAARLEGFLDFDRGCERCDRATARLEAAGHRHVDVARRVGLAWWTSSHVVTARAARLRALLLLPSAPEIRSW